ncbi:unnamed protein product [Tilletia controversa]|nr:unnamed protein product [Tilletia controversa]
MSAQDQTASPRPGSAGADNPSQRQPTLLDIFNAITDIKDRVTSVEQDLTAQRQELATQRAALANLRTGTVLPYQGSALRTPPGLTGEGTAAQGAPPGLGPRACTRLEPSSCSDPSAR